MYLTPLAAAESLDRLAMALVPRMRQPSEHTLVALVEDRPDMAVGLATILMHWRGVETHLICPDGVTVPVIPPAARVILLDEDLDNKERKGLKRCVTGYEIHAALKRRHNRPVVASISLRRAVEGFPEPNLCFRDKLLVAAGDIVATERFIDFMNDLLRLAEHRRHSTNSRLAPTG